LVLGEGIQITPPVLGLIASFGHGQFPVANMPRIAIVSTGDELVKPGTALAEGQIYDSNSYMLAAAVSALGLPKPKIVHARDNEDDTLKAFTEALETADLVISAGGVSVGDHDYVKTVLEERLKVTTVFWRTAIKPGKPVYFSYLDPSPQKRTLIFGLPGNPVSALITFNLFVKPALLALQGARDPRITVDSASMLVDLKKKQGRLEFVRGILGSAKGALNVLPTRGQDSHMLGGLAKANCLIRFPEDKTNLQKGNLVEVEKLNWNNY
ncbi:MAG: molybdopterin molybdotransferase MoeA, partial [Candidatus Obscuribacterales bacterium]|nr:molybdopterin molybdotransferase MoeA [Candidatus Obscuribacterales bacterium]